MLWVPSIHRGIKPALQQGFHRTDSLWDQEVSAEEESWWLWALQTCLAPKGEQWL